MLLSGGTLETSSEGVRKYTPNSNLQHSAVYGNAIAYRYEFNTDSNGFRSTYQCNDIQANSDLVAIAGDSYTEAQGSSISWAGHLQEQICEQGYNSVNTAFAGFGIEDMKMSLEYSYKNLGARKAIVAIIPKDIYRIHVPMIANKTCSMYSPKKNPKCGDTSATWWNYPRHMTDQQLVEFANSKYRLGIIPSIGLLGKKSRLYFKRILWRNKEFMNRFYARRINNSVEAMNSIISLYGEENVLLIILPTQVDRQGKSAKDYKQVLGAHLQIFLDGLTGAIKILDIRDCHLKEDHFLVNDGHPNELGHDQIGACVTSLTSSVAMLDQ